MLEKWNVAFCKTAPYIYLHENKLLHQVKPKSEAFGIVPSSNFFENAVLLSTGCVANHGEKVVGKVGIQNQKSRKI